MHPALLSVAAAGGGTPLDYGDDLFFFLDAENGVTESGGDVSLWTEQGPNAAVYDKPSGDNDPEFDATLVNGLPGIRFGEAAGAGRLSTRVRSADDDLDQLFRGAGFKTLGFACLSIDSGDSGSGFVDPTFQTESFIIDKGTRGTGSDRNGWSLRIDASGSLIFRHDRDDGSQWTLTASGFYSVGDLILGYLRYSGGNSTGSGSFFLYNGSTFVETGTASLGSSTTAGDDSGGNMNVGNQEGPPNGFNAPFQGGIMALWGTKPERTSLNQGYLRRWIA